MSHDAAAAVAVLAFLAKLGVGAVTAPSQPARRPGVTPTMSSPHHRSTPYYGLPHLSAYLIYSFRFHLIRSQNLHIEAQHDQFDNTLCLT